MDVFWFQFFFFFFSAGHLLFMIVVFARNSGAMPAMSLSASCLHSCLGCPLCVAGSSHALAWGQATVGGEKGAGVDN